MRWLVVLVTVAIVGCPDSRPAAPSAPAAVASVGSDARRLSFAELGGWTYELPTEVGERPRPGQIPPRLLALDGSRVRLQGFMHETEEEPRAEVTEFVLLPDHDDCGAPPEMNGWVHVRLAGGRKVTPLHGVKVEVTGRLEVGEVLEGDLVLSLFRLEASDVKVAD